MKVHQLNLKYDVIVIGGGAAGMTAAVSAAERHRNVLLLEKADRPGRKILASGNGRCNLMNSGKPRYYGDPEFARKVLSACTQKDLADFFRRCGLFLTEESEGRIYPSTNQSSTVLSVLKNALAMNGVTVKTNCRVENAVRKDKLFRVHTSSGETAEAEKIIVSCGGAAQPKLGGTTDGYTLLSSFGHRLISPEPSLVPLNTDAKSVSGLSGLRIRCAVSLVRDGETIRREEGEVLFTDYGVSGICVMQCARFITENGYCLLLDLLGHTLPDRNDAVMELMQRKERFASCSPVWLLNGILPEKLSYAVLKQAGLPLRGETAGETDRKTVEKIVDTAYAYRIAVTGSRGLEYAQVTAGGTDCSEFDPSTMESGIVPGLYAAGEVLNVDGDCGGFNLMFAFASGRIAGSAV